MSTSDADKKSHGSDHASIEKASRSGSESLEDLKLPTNVDEKKLLSKLDWKILPVLTLLYLFNFLDRTNIGNAKVAGLATDLKLKGLEYNICAAVFFVTYCVFEVPSNVAIKYFRPNLWLGFIMTVWGVIMLCMSFVKKYEHLLVARIFLGVFEGGLMPGAAFYMSQWYPRESYAQRMGYFLSAATVAGAFGGLLAYGIQHMEGKAHLHGSWIFLLEGLITIIIAVFGLFYLPTYPADAKFITEDERKYLIAKLERSTARLNKSFDWKFFNQAVSDYKVYLYALLFLSVVIPTYCFALFVPTFINDLGFKAATAQAMTTPPYVLSAIITILSGRLSDKYKCRGPFIMGISVFGIVGYAVLYATKGAAVGYVASFIAVAGLFPNIALTISWTSSNFGGELKRSVALAIVIGFGNLGGICSSFVYRTQDAPRYHPGHGTALGFCCLTFVLAGIITFNANRLNKAKAKELASSEDAAVYADMGDASPSFRYIL